MKRWLILQQKRQCCYICIRVYKLFATRLKELQTVKKIKKKQSQTINSSMMGLPQNLEVFFMTLELKPTRMKAVDVWFSYSQMYPLRKSYSGKWLWNITLKSCSPLSITNFAHQLMVSTFILNLSFPPKLIFSNNCVLMNEESSKTAFDFLKEAISCVQGFQIVNPITKK